MKKYLYIYKSELMSDLQYVFNIFTCFIGYFILIYIHLNLWEYIYSDPNELINGYSMKQMVWYVAFAEILWMSLGGRKLCKKICDDVRGGNIAYNINKPYSYIGYSLASHLGGVTVKAIVYLILVMLVGYMFLGQFPSLNILSIIAILITSIIGTVINLLFTISVGLLSFTIEDANPFYWLYSKLILLFGTIFPIEMFPIVIQKVLNISPIYVMIYGPTKLFVDFTWNNFSLVVIAQLIYLLIAYLLCTFMYKKGVKNLNVNGG